MDSLSHLFAEAGALMIAGMVFVFAFLGLLIIFINSVLVKLADKFPDPVVQSSSHRGMRKKSTPNDGNSTPIVAAISAAVTQYRQQHRKNK